MNKPQLAELTCVKLKSKGNTCCVSKMSEPYQTDKLIRKQNCQSKIHFYGSAAYEDCSRTDMWPSDSIGSFPILSPGVSSQGERKYTSLKNRKV